MRICSWKDMPICAMRIGGYVARRCTVIGHVACGVCGVVILTSHA